MAATQNALLSRTRSARVPPGANSSQSLTSTGRSSVRTHAMSTVSNVSLFLTNLRLLEIDHLPDWPDINALTFTNKDATQGQKKRIQSVEWALYQLFTLWDADEACNKLQPFFPPIDQLQSTNLRAALLRCLDQAKKNGILGRDTVLRKTMLDECKGERLEEILAVFSSAVLKKVVQDEQMVTKGHPAIAHNLALEKRGYSGDRTDLNPLILAHKVSLRKKLDQKNAAKAQYKKLAQLLDSKDRELESRQEKTRSTNGQGSNVTLSPDDKTQARRAVRNNWTGNERWMETLLYGDSRSRKDGLLTAPFDRVWRRTRTSRLGELETHDGGLLEQLDGRVNVQKERLDKWKNFRKEMFGNVSTESGRRGSTRVDRQKGIDLGLEVHESLQLGGGMPRKRANLQCTQLHEEYRVMLRNMEAELQHLTLVPAARSLRRLRGRAQDVKSPRQNGCIEGPVEEPLSDLSELEDDIARQSAPANPRPGQQEMQEMTESVETDATLKEPSKRARPKLPEPLCIQAAYRPKPQPTEISSIQFSNKPASSPHRSPTRQFRDESPSPVHSAARTLPPSPQRPSLSQSPVSSAQSPEDMRPSPTQQQAEKILASMNDASPSPVKQSRPRHTLSLAERTRLSMVRGSSLDLDEEDELGLGSPSPTRPRRRDTSSRSPTKHKPGTPTTVLEETGATEADAHKNTDEDDLVARTRRSMANFEATKQKARLDRQRLLKRESRQQPRGSIARQSYFPSQEDDEDSETVVLEELIAEDGEGVDYEAVFKSRPKIKTSPPSTPVRRGEVWE